MQSTTGAGTLADRSSRLASESAPSGKSAFAVPAKTAARDATIGNQRWFIRCERLG
jgi:hypothetical protein